MRLTSERATEPCQREFEHFLHHPLGELRIETVATNLCSYRCDIWLWPIALRRAYGLLAERLFPTLLKTPLGDLPNEVFVVLGSRDQEPFDLVIRCVGAFFREALPQILGGSVVNYDHVLL